MGAASQLNPSPGRRVARWRLKPVRPPVDFATGIIDIAAQLTALFRAHLLAWLTLALRLEALTTFRALTAEIMLLAMTASVTAAIIALGATMSLRQRNAGDRNARAEQQKMR